MESQVGRYGERAAIAIAGQTLTYSEIDELGNRAANVLLDRGLTAGDVVGAMDGNGVPMLATWLGCAKAGLVFLPVNPLLSHDPLRAVLTNSGVTAVVVADGLVPILDDARDGIAGLVTVLTAGTSGPDSFNSVLEQASSQRPDELVDDPSAPAKLMYTSGTTGVPKGVLWSRGCEATHGMAYGDELVPIDPGEGVYCCLPLSHVTCQGTTLATWWRGGCITIDNGFDAFGFWRRVREADAKVFTFVGTILSVLGRRRPHPDDADNPVRRILGAAAPADLWHSIEDRFDLSIVDVWGQTETASCWTNPVSLPQSPGTVGRPTERFEAMLVDPAGDDREPVAEETPGELWIRPTRPQVMFEGYLAADGTIDRSAFTDDGWYRTGDLMTQTADGDYRFAGRIREAIRRRGEMISAGPIEAAARGHDAVAEAAAVGVPDEHGVEEEIKLCVVVHDDTDVDPADLHAHLRTRLPRFMVPRYIDLRTKLPKTPSTRVRKFALVAEGTEGTWDARHPEVRPVRVPADTAPVPSSSTIIGDTDQ